MHKTVLDPCCGSRMCWFDPTRQDVLFGDIRSERQNLCDGRLLEVLPDMRMDFRSLPFGNESFQVVAFDPPHLLKAGPKSWLAAKYGKLSESWREDLRKGFSECWRVLEPGGVLIFKWNETQVKVREVLELTPAPPLFGHLSGRKGLTHWLVFMKEQTK